MLRNNVLVFIVKKQFLIINALFYLKIPHGLILRSTGSSIKYLHIDIYYDLAKAIVYIHNIRLIFSFTLRVRNKFCATFSYKLNGISNFDSFIVELSWLVWNEVILVMNDIARAERGRGLTGHGMTAPQNYKGWRGGGTSPPPLRHPNNDFDWFCLFWHLINRGQPFTCHLERTEKNSIFFIISYR